MPLTLPSSGVIDAIHGAVTRVTRRVAFFESDGVTPWQPEGQSPGLHGGSVTMDHARDERRAFQLSIWNEGGLYKSKPDGLWYDKIVKVYRGVRLSGGSEWEGLLGTFMIDEISDQHHPNTVAISGRDYTKKLKTSKFPFTTLFPVNHPIEEVIRDIAVNGGIPIGQMDLPLTGENLGYDYTFDQGSERWAAIKDVAIAYGYEVFFDAQGILTMREFQDPTTLLPAYTFETGANSNIAEYSRRLTDAHMRNHISVVGENSNQVPVFAEAKNTSAGSPTRIAKVGQRTELITSSFVETHAQALKLARDMLKVSALEQYEIDLSTIVVPYIDVGVVVSFIDPSPVPGDPTNFLLGSVTVPLGLGTMSAAASRIINVEPS